MKPLYGELDYKANGDEYMDFTENAVCERLVYKVSHHVLNALLLAWLCSEQLSHIRVYTLILLCIQWMNHHNESVCPLTGLD